MNRNVFCRDCRYYAGMFCSYREQVKTPLGYDSRFDYCIIRNADYECKYYEKEDLSTFRRQVMRCLRFIAWSGAEK